MVKWPGAILLSRICHPCKTFLGTTQGEQSRHKEQKPYLKCIPVPSSVFEIIANFGSRQSCTFNLATLPPGYIRLILIILLIKLHTSYCFCINVRA